MPIYVFWMRGLIHLHSKQLLTGKHLLLSFFFFFAKYYSFCPSLSSLLPYFLFSWFFFFCSDMVWFPSHFLSSVFCIYCLCGYHGDYITYPKGITIYFKLITSTAHKTLLVFISALPSSLHYRCDKLYLYICVPVNIDL